MTDPSVRIVSCLSEFSDGWYTILTTRATWPSPLGDKRGPFKFTQADLEQMAANHDREIPIDLHHATARGKTDPESTAARGWITALRVVDDALQAAIRWTEEGADLVKKEAFRFFSAEPARARAKDTGKEVGWKLLGGTLTNRPVFDLPAFVLSEEAAKHINPDAMPGAPISEPKQNPSASADHVTHEENHMSDEEKTALSVQLAELTGEVAKLSEAREALLSELKDARERADKADERVATIEAERATEKLLLSGRITKDEEAVACKLFTRDRELFDELFAGRKEGHAVPVGESGKDKPDDRTTGPMTFEEADAQLMKLAEEAAKDGEDPTTYYGAILKEHPEIRAAYLEN